MGYGAILLAAAFAAPALAVPRAVIERYAILTAEGLRAKGLTVANGDLGVTRGKLVVTEGLAAPASQLVADAVRITGPAACVGIHADGVEGATASCPRAGDGAGTLFADLHEACGAPPALPACAAGTRLVVETGTARTLPPGVYGDLVVRDGASVGLRGGRYVFCSLRATRSARVRLHGPAELVVTGSVLLDRGSSLAPDPDIVLGASDVRLITAGKTVKVARGARLVARLCASRARLVLREAVFDGTAVARRARAITSEVAAPYVEEREPCVQRSRLRDVYFGDLHVHTTLSFDAYAFDVRTTPDDAYAFARGATVALPPLDAVGAGTRTVQIDRPLDFAALTDHSEFLGEVELCTTPGSAAYDSAECQNYRLGGNAGTTSFGTRLALDPPARAGGICGAGGATCLGVASAVWDRVRQAAADAYDRTAACRFTSFVGYEYTASQQVSTLHRNVVFRSDRVPFPTTVFEQPTGPGLWTELRATCAAPGIGCDVLVIPHNANESNGKMFRAEYPGTATLDDERAQARLRGSIEPLVEVYQHKGAGECLAGISGIVGATDEQCGFEQRYLPSSLVVDCGDGVGAFGTITAGCTSRRDYLRGALLEGLLEDARLGVNPFRLGVIGSTDTHNGTPGAVAEDAFAGNRGLDDGTPADRLGEGQFYRGGWRFSPGGLVAVWAEENTRPAIFDALRRREVYGTSGPRLAIRVFGGFGLATDLCGDPAMLERAYAAGVPMGGLLGPGSGAPRFLVAASKDPGTPERPGLPLQRAQVVKLWLADGVRHERVYDVAGDGANGATVDDATCEPSGPGFDSLCTVWTDPEFDPAHRAAYYVRVLENPSCRWSTRQCNALAPAERPPACDDQAVARAVQERAWTSPIWHEPSL